MAGQARPGPVHPKPGPSTPKPKPGPKFRPPRPDTFVNSLIRSAIAAAAVSAYVIEVLFVGGRSDPHSH
jgi:hypothetical protein